VTPELGQVPVVWDDTLPLIGARSGRRRHVPALACTQAKHKHQNAHTCIYTHTPRSHSHTHARRQTRARARARTRRRRHLACSRQHDCCLAIRVGIRCARQLRVRGALTHGGSAGPDKQRRQAVDGWQRKEDWPHGERGEGHTIFCNYLLSMIKNGHYGRFCGYASIGQETMSENESTCEGCRC
jgi:hypothetical protein